MKITFESDILLPTLSKAINELTNSNTVCLNDIHYDEAQSTVEIYLQRREITGYKKPDWFRVWGEGKPIYGQTRVRSSLLIRQVEGVEINVDDRLITECNSCFTLESGVLMGGVLYDRNAIYLRSLEEASGKTFCTVEIMVKKWDIEYAEAVVKM